MKTILDISKHQGGINLNRLTGVDGVIYRRCIGSSSLDPCFDSFCSQKEPIGLYVRSYAKDETEAVGEAIYICNAAESKGLKNIAIFFDWEYFSATYIKNKFGITATPALVQALTVAFCETVIKRGFKTGVYFNKGYLDRFYTKAFFEKHTDYLKWYARPDLASPDFECDLWQYASNEGNEFGYSGSVDKNIMYTDFTDTADLQPMKPISSQSIRLKIGFASAGDIRTLKAKIEGLGIACVAADGYIITSEASAGDQCYILTDCNNLNIPCVEYKEETPEQPTDPEPTPEPTPEPDPKPEQPEKPKEDPKDDNKPKEDEPQEKPAKKKSILELIIDFIFALFEGK